MTYGIRDSRSGLWWTGSAGPAAWDGFAAARFYKHKRSAVRASRRKVCRRRPFSFEGGVIIKALPTIPLVIELP